MLERLFVDNYRCLVNFEIRPEQSLLLVGRNGTGKTSLWEVLASLQDVIARGEGVDTVFPDTSRARWESRDRQTFELDIRLQETLYSYKLVIRQSPLARRGASPTIIEREEVIADQALLYRRSEDGVVELLGDHEPASAPRTTIPFDLRRSFLSALQSRPENRRLRAFRDYIESMLLVSIGVHAIEAESADEDEVLRRDASNFCAWLRSRTQDEPRILTSIEDDLRSSISGFDRITSEKLGVKARRYLIHTKVSGGVSATIAFGELSDGEKILFINYGLLRGAGAGSLMFLDEPDNFLALSELQPWLVKLREAVLSNHGQLIVASHHAHTIDYLAADQVIVLSRTEGGPVRAGGLEFPLESGLKASDWLAQADSTAPSP